VEHIICKPKNNKSLRKNPASRLRRNKSEQGESNAEGMGCTQQNFYSPVHNKPRVDSLY
jgi:hypothetical protein